MRALNNIITQSIQDRSTSSSYHIYQVISIIAYSSFPNEEKHFGKKRYINILKKTAVFTVCPA